MDIQQWSLLRAREGTVGRTDEGNKNPRRGEKGGMYDNSRCVNKGVGNWM